MASLFLAIKNADALWFSFRRLNCNWDQNSLENSCTFDGDQKELHSQAQVSLTIFPASLSKFIFTLNLH